MSDFINWLIPLENDHRQSSIIEQTKHIIRDKGAGNYICVYINIDGRPHVCVVKFDKRKVCSDCRHDFQTNRDDDTETSEAIARSVFEQMGCDGVNDDRAKEGELKSLIDGKPNVQNIFGDKQTIRNKVEAVFLGTIKLGAHSHSVEQPLSPQSSQSSEDSGSSSFDSQSTRDSLRMAREKAAHSKHPMLTSASASASASASGAGAWYSMQPQIQSPQTEAIFVDNMLVCSDHGTKATVKSCGNNVSILMPKKIDVKTSYYKRDLSEVAVRVNSSETYRVGAFTVSHDGSVSATLFIEHGFEEWGEYYTETSFYMESHLELEEKNIVFNISKIVELVSNSQISPSNGALAKFIADRLPLILHILKKSNICNQDSTILIETHDTRAFLDICKPLIYDTRYGDFREVEMTTLFARKITRNQLGELWAAVIVYGSSDLSRETAQRINESEQARAREIDRERQGLQQEVETLKRILNDELDVIQQFMIDWTQRHTKPPDEQRGRAAHTADTERQQRAEQRADSRERERNGTANRVVTADRMVIAGRPEVIKGKTDFIFLFDKINDIISKLVALIQSSHTFDLGNFHVEEVLLIRLKDVKIEMENFSEFVMRRDEKFFVKIEEFISRIEGVGAGARGRSKGGKCQYGKNKITKHRRIRSKNNKMKRKNKITKKIINNRKR